MLTRPKSDSIQRLTWGGLLTVVTVVSTLATACGTPFAALGALGALFLPRRDAFLLVKVNWLANQAIGFIWLHYPHTRECYVGGIGLGMAALLGTLAAIAVSSRLRQAGPVLKAIVTFTAAFLAYEGVLFAISPSNSSKAFALPIVIYILWVNGIAFVALLAIHTAGQGARICVLGSASRVGSPSSMGLSHPSN